LLQRTSERDLAYLRLAQLLDLGYTDVRVLRPSQFSISDGQAVFNCAIPASNDPADEKTEDKP
jgi:hypothetical protein